MGYRDPVRPIRPQAVIDYRPMSRLASGLLSLLFVAMGLFAAFMSLSYVCSARLECDRSGLHACALVRDYGFYSSRRLYPIDDVRSVIVTRHSGKNSTTYSVDFALKSGPTEQLSRSGAKRSADDSQAAINAFLADGSAGPRTIPLNGRMPFFALLFAVMAIGTALSSGIVLGSAELRFDFDRQKIEYTRRRFPLRPIVRKLDAFAVKSARVNERPGGKGGTVYNVSLLLTDGEELPLLTAGSSPRKRHDEAAAAINTHLTAMRDL